MAKYYIEKNEFKESITAFIKLDEYYHPYGKHKLIPISEVLDRLEQSPAADVQEVKHAHWVPKHHPIGRRYCECSNCQEEYDCGLFGDYNYCPNCGAKMDGKGNEKV